MNISTMPAKESDGVAAETATCFCAAPPNSCMSMAFALASR